MITSAPTPTPAQRNGLGSFVFGTGFSDNSARCKVFDEIVCLEMGSSKATELTRWEGSGYFWIEDHMRQAEAGHEAGLKTVLIDHPYNSHYKTDLFPTVSYTKPWEEIYDMVCKEYGID